MSGPPGHTTYGRACVNCARGKCKCILHDGSATCERCLRLKKNCQFTSGIRKKPGRKPTSKPANLQEKLNDLVDLLKSVPGVGDAADALLGATPVPPTGSVTEGSTSNGTVDNAVITNPSPLDYTTAHASPASIAGLIACDISPTEAEESLRLFRLEKLKYFPFFHVPRTVTAAQLREKSPLLWLSIMASSSKIATRQQALGKQLQDIVTEHVVGRHQRSLDILLGILGFLGWMTYFLGPQPFMIMYCHIAVAIVQDLGMDKPSFKPNEIHPMACVKHYGFVMKLPRSHVQTMEERRAVLACFFITNVIGDFLKKPLGLPWSDHLEECLRILDTAPETNLDHILVHQIRLQRLHDDIPKALVADGSSTEQTKLFLEFRTKMMLMRLHEEVQKLPADLPEDVSVVCRLHTITTEAIIQGVATYSAISETGQPDLQRISMLSACMRLTKAWYDQVFDLPKNVFLMFAFPIITQLSYFLSLLYRLSTLDVPCWDAIQARQALAVSETLDELAMRFAEGPIEAGFVGGQADENIFNRGAPAIRMIKSTWESAWMHADIQAPPQQQQHVGPSNGTFESIAEEGIINQEFSLDFTDGLDGWLTDLFTPEWYVGV